MKVAVLDLGTNVFNLLIASISKNRYKIDKIHKVPSFMGSEGFSTGRLSEEAINSSMNSLEVLDKEIRETEGIELIKAFATSAVRDASNGEAFTSAVKERFGIDVEVISGEREAELIYKAVLSSVLLYDEKALICDIGGGSIEMIIADKEKIFWKESFNLGVVRLKELFKPSDPLTKEQIEAIEKFIYNSLGNFWAAYKVHSPCLLIGTSGTFDTFRELMFPDDDGKLPAASLQLPAMKDLNEKLITSCRSEKLVMPRMPVFRVDYIALGSIFVKLLLENCRIKELCQSAYSLKEGYMAELAENSNK